MTKTPKHLDQAKGGRARPPAGRAGWAVRLPVLVGLLLAFGSGTQGPEAKEASPPRFVSAEACKACHQEVYEQWKKSYHARSLGPTFQAMYRIYTYNTGGKAPAFCFDCHTAETKLNPEKAWILHQEVMEGKAQLSSEGVTCMVCHAVTDVKDAPDYQVPLSLDPPQVPPFHSVKRTTLTTSAKLCSACHDYNTAHFLDGRPKEPGPKCCSVNREWKETSYAKKGIGCQDCHMREEMGVVQRTTGSRITDKLYRLVGLQRYRDDRGRVSHLFPGGRSESLLKKSVEMQIKAEQAEDRITAAVILTSRAGHTIPNG